MADADFLHNEAEVLGAKMKQRAIFLSQWECANTCSSSCCRYLGTVSSSNIFASDAAHSLCGYVNI
jgi:hypothetical protein